MLSISLALVAVLGLDSTAHPAGAFPIHAVQTGATSSSSVTTPSFSTGAGPILLVAAVAGDAAGVAPGNSVSNTSGLTWTLRRSDISATAHTVVTNCSVTNGSAVLTVNSITSGGNNIAVGDQVFVSGWSGASHISSLGTGSGGTGTYNMAGASASTHPSVTCWLAYGLGTQIYTAYSAGSLSTQTVTYTAGLPGQPFEVNVTVINGVPGSEAACIGSGTNGYEDEANTLTVSKSINPQSTGSWLVGVVYWDSGNTMTANAQASAFDYQDLFGDAWSWGRYKSGGTVATTTAGTPVLWGSSDTDAPDTAVSVLEVCSTSCLAAASSHHLPLLGAGH
jgi:hypothetical protein